MVKTDRENSRYYSISVVARLLGVHQQTLRIYEKEGLIKPTRTEGNTRLFSEEDIEDLRFILRLTNDLGVNLAGVGVIMELRQQMEEMEEMYRDQMQVVFAEFSRQLQNFVKEESCLPVRSYRANLILRQERHTTSQSRKRSKRGGKTSGQ